MAGSGRRQRTILPAESPHREFRIQMQQQVTCAIDVIGTACCPLDWERRSVRPSTPSVNAPAVKSKTECDEAMRECHPEHGSRDGSSMKSALSNRAISGVIRPRFISAVRSRTFGGAASHEPGGAGISQSLESMQAFAYRRPQPLGEEEGSPGRGWRMPRVAFNRSGRPDESSRATGGGCWSGLAAYVLPVAR